MRHLTLLALAVGLVLAGCGPYATSLPKAAVAPRSPTADPHPFLGTLTGTLTAPACGGTYQLDNAVVEVRDEHDTLIGAATTTARETDEDVYGPGHYRPGYCRATFTVQQLPKAQAYHIAIGNHGGPTYAYAELAAAGWIIVWNLN